MVAYLIRVIDRKVPTLSWLPPPVQGPRAQDTIVRFTVRQPYLRIRDDKPDLCSKVDGERKRTERGYSPSCAPATVEVTGTNRREGSNNRRV